MERQELIELGPGEAEAIADMRSLHRATLSLFADLSLDGVLRRITIAARELARARYAAIGIPDRKGELEIFITDGMSVEEIQRIPHPPKGRGLIGEMMRTGESVRFPDISDHPKASGFPPGHPIMHSFLGVPITAYGRPLGQIYLTDKIDASEFSLHDQRLIEMLAAHAAAAIENARLYRQVLESEKEVSQRNEQLELINDLTSAISEATDLESLLTVMLERVIQLIEAGSGVIFLADEGENCFRLAAHHGEEEAPIWNSQRFCPGEGFLGMVAENGKLAWSTNLEQETDYLREGILEAGYRTIVAVPLPVRGEVVGVLSLAFKGIRRISQREVGLLEAIGAGVGVGIENARLNRQARRIAVIEERERIGMDLHDGIIQSIYAVGLTLDSIRVMIGDNPDEALALLERAIDGLNANIRDIRSYILDLQPSRFEGTDLEQGLSRLSQEFKANTMVDIDTRIEPEAVSKIDGEVSRTLLHITQEALANVAKHANASRVWVSMRKLEDCIYLQIIDNGIGFDLERQPELLGHGLSNMDQRARQVSGEFEAVSSPGEGTTITVRIDSNSAGI